MPRSNSHRDFQEHRANHHGNGNSRKDEVGRIHLGRDAKSRKMPRPIDTGPTLAQSARGGYP